MIIDLQAFIAGERKHWVELEGFLDRLDREPRLRLSIDEAKRFHYLYERAASGLGKITTFSTEPELRGRLEGLVARAYAEIHTAEAVRRPFSPWRWLSATFPRTLRRHIGALGLSLAATLIGTGFGWLAVATDPEAKAVILPFAGLLGDPSERVKIEESAQQDRLAGHKGQFSTYLMTHNIRVSIFALALGMTWGAGTLLLLFYNGVILGAVALDYVRAGQTRFLLGWLLPHGAVEIPAILIAGQAGFVLAHALIGRGTRIPLARRLRAATGDVVTLIGGVALMLVWAGFVEAFLSQYHEPAIPYSAKILFGAIELGILAAFFSFAGTRTRSEP